MSEKIALPPLPTWLTSHLTALYTAKSEEQFTQAFDNFVAHRVHSIVFNGKTISRDEYKRTILSEKPATSAATATLKFDDAVEANPSSSGAENDTVGVSFTARITNREPIEESTLKSNIIVEVENDPSIHVPHIPGTRGGGADTRRVFKLTQVLNRTVGPEL